MMLAPAAAPPIRSVGRLANYKFQLQWRERITKDLKQVRCFEEAKVLLHHPDRLIEQASYLISQPRSSRILSR